MATCKTCANTRTVDHGLDVATCKDCQPELPKIRAYIKWLEGMGTYHNDLDELAILVDRWEELVKVLEPADWQTPLQRAQELRDNLVITGQIKTIMSRS